jgi:hypothetical protein
MSLAEKEILTTGGVLISLSLPTTLLIIALDHSTGEKTHFP